MLLQLEKGVGKETEGGNAAEMKWVYFKGQIVKAVRK
jgi:hypothetical protein